MAFLRFRRCKVGNKIDPFFRFAWIPVDKAEFGERVKLQFESYSELDYEIVDCDDLIVDGWLLPYLQPPYE